MHKILHRCILPLLLICLAFAPLRAQVAETPLEQHIRAVNKLIQERRANRNLQGQDLYDQLTDTTGLQLPVGIGGKDSGKPPIIIDSIRFTPTHAEITAYLVVPLPGSDRELMFAGRGIPISREGGLRGTARLELVNNQPLYLFGDSTAITMLGGKTFVEFDCDGFKRMGLGAEIAFSPKLVKENADGSQNAQERVKGYFETVASDLNDIITTVSIEPFQVRGMNGVSFTVQDAVIDLSDYQNSASMVFPAEYRQMYGGEELNLWRGFYLRNFTVALPPEIKDRRENGKRKTFSVRDALIDDKGFSGELIAQNLIPINSGDMSGWSFSVEEIRIGFVANQLKSGKLSGGVNVPITGDTTAFKYSALFHPGKEYVFTIQTTKDVKFDIFKAGKVVLESSSFLEVAVKDKKFQVAANLTGSLSIGAEATGEGDGNKGGKGSKINMPGLDFEQLVVSTQAPYIHSGTFALTGTVGAKIGGYGITIDKITFVKVDNERGIGFDVSVNLMGGSNAFAAEASLAILGEVQENEGRQRYRFSRVHLSRIAVDIDQGPFALKGSLLFFNGHDIYGDGFRGDIDVKLKVGKSSSGFRMAAMALFGSVNDNRYWYADILVEFPYAIPIFPPVMAKGFGGGLYYGVKQLAVKESSVGYEIGTTPTGVVYKPDANAGLGIKASINFALANEKVLNGTVGFEMAFYRDGGVSRITFRGQCNVITQPMPGVLEKIKDKYGKVLEHTGNDVTEKMDQEGQISVGLLVDVDFENSTFYSNLKAYINIAGGALKGIGPNGLAGEGVMYVGPDGWYLHIGTPSNPVGVELLGLARAYSYFMVGKDLPGSPPPPPKVSEILGGLDLDYMRDLNALGKGSGFAFGAGLEFDTGDMTFLIFYARLAAGLGFDIMLKDYGKGVHCEGSEKPLGINGWYANGQIYGYFQGKIGIKVKLFFKKIKIDIIDLGAAVVLQAKLPNPAWMRGVVGGYFSVLGGLVKGKCKFEMTLGRECKIVGSDIFAEAGVKVISEATPAGGEGDVNVFTAPQIVFNMPVGKNFTLTDNSDKVHTFRARLEHFNLRDGATLVPGSLEWNSDNTVVVLNTPEVLPQQKKLRITARLSFEEMENGSWKPFVVDGKPYTEEVDQEFSSGTAPDNIPANNVQFSYPVLSQLNYYKAESNQGYIQLKKGQAYLFNAGNEFKQVGRLLADGNTTAEFSLSYSNGRITYTMPESIKNSQVYSLDLMNVPAVSNQSIDRNVTTQQTAVAGNEAGEISLQTRHAEGNISNMEEKVIYQLPFRSSAFNTFNEKIDRSPVYSNFTWPLRTGVYELGLALNAPELFDEQELDANGNSKLLQFEAVLTDNSWYQQYIYPYVYEGYPAAYFLTIQWRNTSTLGAPPAKGIFIRQVPNGLQLQPNGNNTYSGTTGFVYNLPHYIERDYLDMQSAVVNGYVNGFLPSLSPNQSHLVTTPFTPISRGAYRFRVKYVLPGTNQVTSEKEITIQNTLGSL
ncbi:hypothetical protein [Chitinophaga barathri]|uniref:Uncharacterized protein n=1 Tax=Chitinophaga barathri TaxID=1647451 RepID=A0A3N4MEV1_9BACT|nr:hypothetical protein [Chitinophaga barathri]RPD42464.1 hypothetical protein EG028_04625 [Chitinophaga barathri]